MSAAGTVPKRRRPPLPGTRRGRLRQRVLDILAQGRNVGGPPLVTKQIAEKCAETRHGIRKILNELVDEGRVVRQDVLMDGQTHASWSIPLAGTTEDSEV